MPSDEARAAVAARAGERKRGVVNKAAELFDTRGFHNTSMDDIADAVGLRKPSLYHYFSSKDEILYLIHDEFIEVLISRHERRLTMNMEPASLLLETMGDIIELMETHRGHVRVFFEAHRVLPEGMHDDIVRKRRHYQHMITEVFERGAADGSLKCVYPELAAQGLFGMCTWAYQWYRADGPLRPRDIAYFFWDALMHGMATTKGAVAGAT